MLNTCIFHQLPTTYFCLLRQLQEDNCVTCSETGRLLQYCAARCKIYLIYIYILLCAINVQRKGKGKGHPRIGHEDPEGIEI